MKYTLTLLALLVGLCALPACANTSAARTNSLQSRQDWMNSRASAAAERRQIRSDNMDARTAAMFDAM